jgi:hypothetical protein
MQAQALIDIDVKVGGVTFPFVFIVMEKLGFDCILGLDLLNEAQALVDVAHNTLQLFGGLTTVPMTTTGNHVVVSTVTSVIIPPFSEAVVAVRPNRKTSGGQFMIEGEAKSPCAALMVARSEGDLCEVIISDSKGIYCCHHVFTCLRNTSL